MPAEHITRTGAPGFAEHFLAYFIASICVAIGFVNQFSKIRISLGLVVFAGAMELAQNFIPSRDPNILDFLSGAIGVVSGIALVYLMPSVRQAINN